MLYLPRLRWYHATEDAQGVRDITDSAMLTLEAMEVIQMEIFFAHQPLEAN